MVIKVQLSIIFIFALVIWIHKIPIKFDWCNMPHFQTCIKLEVQQHMIKLTSVWLRFESGSPLLECYVKKMTTANGSSTVVRYVSYYRPRTTNFQKHYKKKTGKRRKTIIRSCALTLRSTQLKNSSSLFNSLKILWKIEFSEIINYFGLKLKFEQKTFF